jgi:ketosteroid isomerase-like protein
MNEVEQAIAEQWDTWERTASEMDYDSWLPYWTSDPWLLRAGMNLRGSDLHAVAKDFFRSGVKDYSLHVDSFEIFVHGDVAYQIGQYDESYQMPGEERTEDRNYFFAKWKKEDGTWKIDRIVAGAREAPAEA